MSVFFSFLADLGEGLFALVLVVVAGFGDGVGRGVAFLLHLLAELLVVHLVAIFALHVGAQLLHELFLQAAHGFDGFVGHFEGLEQVGLAHFLHFALDHHDVLLGGAHHDVHVGVFELLERGVDHVLAVDAGHAHLRDGAFERNVRAGQGSRGGKACQSVGHVYAVGGVERDVDVDFGVIVAREEGTQRAVDQTRGENFIVGGTPFALREASGETPGGCVFFLVVTLQGHEVRAGDGVLCAAHCGQQHRVVQTEHDGAVGLLGQLAGLDADGAPIGQRDGLGNHVHRFIVLKLVRIRL